ncbi:oxidoreductase [Microbispora rosea subsp. aerata]|nr:acyl-CoA dehydrogenase family protein [Microbispora rosea]GGO03323.1 oxidoreductase [Microbispora rosea subsp. aerata]GIH54787.1 oxidoreductase [Microbispora rosea subsp. aerata]
MEFMAKERAELEHFLPGLDDKLAAVPLADLERPGNPGLPAFKAAGGPRLLVPTEFHGLGATPLQAVRVHRALGSRSPSLAIAATMHGFSVAGLVEVSQTSTGFEWMLLEGIARENLLLASAFAEGRTGAPILSPTLRAVRRGDNLVVSGSKKPCTLSRSMDMLTASVTVADDEGRDRLAVVLIPAGSPGIEIRPFWNSFVLAGAESDEVVLKDVEVSRHLVVMTEATEDQQLDELQSGTFLWFELLVSASYLGVASALAERVLLAGKADAVERAALIIEAEAAMTTLEGVARAMGDGERGQDMFAKALCARYAVQDAIGRIARRATELLGGMAYIGSGDVAYLSAASAALMFHPPSRARMSQQLCDYFAGQPLRVA